MSKQNISRSSTATHLISIVGFLASIASIIALVLYMRDANLQRNKQIEDSQMQATEIAKLDSRFHAQETAVAAELYNQRVQINRQDTQIEIAKIQVTVGAVQNKSLTDINNNLAMQATLAAKQLDKSNEAQATPFANDSARATATSEAAALNATQDALNNQQMEIQATQTAIAQSMATILNGEWEGFSVVTDGRQYPFVWQLAQVNNKIQGIHKWGPGPGAPDVVAGTIEGIIIGTTVNLTRNDNGSSYQGYLMGLLSDNNQSISGTWSDNIGNKGTWKAIKTP